MQRRAALAVAAAITAAFVGASTAIAAGSGLFDGPGPTGPGSLAPVLDAGGPAERAGVAPTSTGAASDLAAVASPEGQAVVGTATAVDERAEPTRAPSSPAVARLAGADRSGQGTPDDVGEGVGDPWPAQRHEDGGRIAGHNDDD